MHDRLPGPPVVVRRLCARPPLLRVISSSPLWSWRRRACTYQSSTYLCAHVTLVRLSPSQPWPGYRQTRPAWLCASPAQLSPLHVLSDASGNPLHCNHIGALRGVQKPYNVVLDLGPPYSQEALQPGWLLPAAWVASRLTPPSLRRPASSMVKTGPSSRQVRWLTTTSTLSSLLATPDGTPTYRRLALPRNPNTRPP